MSATVEEARAEAKALLAELTAGHLPAVTGKQAARAAAFISGKSTSAIAKAENVSRQAVEKSLGTRGVRETLVAFGYAMRIQRDEQGSIPVAQALLQEITQTALSAKRPIVLSHSDGERAWQTIEWVDDHRLRFDASTRLLTLLGDAEAAASPPAPNPKPPPPTIAEEVDVAIETHTTRTRARRVHRST